jgi:hypothetical protein
MLQPPQALTEPGLIPMVPALLRPLPDAVQSILHGSRSGG